MVKLALPPLATRSRLVAADRHQSHFIRIRNFHLVRFLVAYLVALDAPAQPAMDAIKVRRCGGTGAQRLVLMALVPLVDAAPVPRVAARGRAPPGRA